MPQKKKNSSKKKASGKPAKFTVPSPSKMVTRSTGDSPNIEDKGAGSVSQTTPPQAQPSPTVANLTTPITQADLLQSIAASNQAMEERWDVRMSRMETTIRSSITQSTASQAAAPPAAPSVSPPAASLPAQDYATPTQGQEAAGGSSSRSSSSSSGTSSDSRYSRSSSRSTSRRRHRRRRHRRSRTSSRSKKHSKYTSARYLKEGERISTYERLVRVNIKMAASLLKRGKDISGFLDHFLMVAEKAESTMFEPITLIGYDESVKESAKELGMKAFSKIDPARIMKFLCYDGTRNAHSAKNAAAKKPSGFKPPPRISGVCIKFNSDPSGCPRGKDCPYRHVCQACKVKGHVTEDCPNVVKPAPHK